MRPSLYILLIVLMFSRCSNDFLHPTYPEMVMMNDTIWIEPQYKYYTVKLHLGDAVKENSPFRVIYYPIFILKDTFEGQVKNGTAEISFSPYNDLNYYIHSGMQEALLKIDVGNGKECGFIIVIKEEGKSYTGLTMYQNELVFDHSSLATINFENATPKTINWSVTKMPDWMWASQTQGTMTPKSLGYINFTISNGLVAGFDYTGEVVIETTNPTASYKFPIEVVKWY